MVHLATLERINENYRKYRQAIINSGHRFAVVHSDKIEYYDDRERLYKAHPCFSPDVKLAFGTHPRLVDIGMETHSLEYLRERIEEDKINFSNQLVDLLEKGDRLAENDKELSVEEARAKKQ